MLVVEKIGLIINVLYLEVWAVLCLVAQCCLALCDPVGCSLPGSSIHGDSPGKDTAVGCHALLQGINQELNPDLPRCGGYFTVWATREAQRYVREKQIKNHSMVLTMNICVNILPLTKMKSLD